MISLLVIGELQADAKEMSRKLGFGNKETSVEVYLFTDWYCPACHALEPSLKTLIPKIQEAARIHFIDVPLHKESINYIPYNITFMLKNKPEYLELRAILDEMTSETKQPTDEKINAAIAHLGVNYEQLNYSEIDQVQRYFIQMVNKFRMRGTPTMVIFNRRTKKSERLRGPSNITEKNVMKAIKKLEG